MQEIVPHSGVVAMDHASFLILDRGEIESDILLVEKKKQPGVWGLPGGHSEPAEPELTTMYRETIEEIGITIEGADEITRIAVEDPSPHLFIVYGAFVPHFDLKRLRLGPEIGNATFFPERTLKGLIAAGLVRHRHVRAIEDYWQKRCP